MWSESEQAIRDYSEYLRPWLGELLQALKLDLPYTRADGNQLFSPSCETPILDFLGGYGANLFGHYHPRLKARALELLQAQVPQQAQGSIRRYPAALARRLSELTERVTGQPAVVTLTNTGAETVEAAIKHACLARQEFVAHFLKDFHTRASHLRVQGALLSEASFGVLRACGYEADGDVSPQALQPALAFAEAYNREILTQSPILLALKRGFHGKTTGAVQLTHNPLYRYPLEPFGLPTRFISPERAALEAEVAQGRSAVIALTPDHELSLRPWNRVLGCFLEPLQGEGGIHPLPASFLQSCRELADHDDFLLILDEIQCGMGRTGTFYYSEQAGIAADYYLLAKSLGGGLSKVGALIIRADKYCRRFGEVHSSTFAEDEFSAALALSALDLLESEQLMLRARAQGAFLLQGLRALQARYPEVIHEVRGVGLMLGVEFADFASSASPALQMLARQELLGYVMTGYLLHEHGIRLAPTLSAPRCLRLEPAASLSQAECKRVLEAFAQLCEVLQKVNIFHLTRFLVGRHDGDPGISDCHQPLSWRDPRSDLPQVAFAGHFISAQHLPLWDRGFDFFSPSEREAYVTQVYRHLEPQIYDRPVVRSATGAEVQLNFVGLCVSSRQMHQHLRRDPEPMRALLEQALDCSVAAGCTVLGLGGYNSIVTANGQALTADRLALTTGNALTVGMGWRAIHQAAAEQGIEIASSCFAAIGAVGNIASVYTELMADEVPALILCGHPGHEARLARLAGRLYTQALERIQAALEAGAPETLQGLARALYRHPALHDFDLSERSPEALMALHAALQVGAERPPLRWGTDLTLLSEAQLILGASNAPETLIFPQHLSAGPVLICDISVPMDTHPEVLSLERVQVIQGGIVRLAENADFQIGGIPLEPGLSFACMAETLLMGLEGIQSHGSYGRIRREQVEAMLALADKHGFVLARPRLENSY